MALYAITGIVETINLNIGHYKGAVIVDVPQFYVEAASKAEAQELGGQIIDPLHMTGVREIYVRRAKKKKGKK
jgi:hypothetical protein